MIRINLLPVRAAQKKERLVSQLVVLGLVVGGAVSVCVFAQIWISGRVSAEQDRIQQAQSDIDQLKRQIGEVAQIKKLQKELQGKLDILNELKAKKTGPVRLLDALSRVTPDKLWIDSFRETGGSVSLSGFALNEENIAGFMRDLDTSPYYQKVELQVVEQATVGGNRLQRFSISCQTELPEITLAR